MSAERRYFRSISASNPKTTARGRLGFLQVDNQEFPGLGRIG
jgi:hypothetical protein